MLRFHYIKNVSTTIHEYFVFYDWRPLLFIGFIYTCAYVNMFIFGAQSLMAFLFFYTDTGTNVLTQKIFIYLYLLLLLALFVIMLSLSLFHMEMASEA